MRWSTVLASTEVLASVSVLMATPPPHFLVLPDARRSRVALVDSVVSPASLASVLLAFFLGFFPHLGRLHRLAVGRPATSPTCRSAWRHCSWPGARDAEQLGPSLDLDLSAFAGTLPVWGLRSLLQRLLGPRRQLFCAGAVCVSDAVVSFVAPEPFARTAPPAGGWIVNQREERSTALVSSPAMRSGVQNRLRRGCDMGPPDRGGWSPSRRVRESLFRTLELRAAVQKESCGPLTVQATGRVAGVARRSRHARPRRPRGPSHVGERHVVDVGPVAHGGHCVARLDSEGRVVFVRHAPPG